MSTRTPLSFFLAASALAAFSVGCAAPKILGPSTLADDALAKQQLGAALATGKLECKKSDSTESGVFVVCEGDPANVFVALRSRKVSAPYVSIFTTWKQPLCEEPAFLARVEAYNARDFGTTAYCSTDENSAARLTFRVDSYLPVGGIAALELSTFVHRWVDKTIDQASAAGLFEEAPPSSASEEPPKTSRSAP